MAAPELILFDLDGTLIDHFGAIYRSYVHVQEALGLPVSSFATVKRTVGGSIPVTLQRLLGDEHVAAALPLWREHFAATMLDDVTKLPGVDEGLRELQEAGFRLVVFTNKDGPAAREVIGHLGWSGFFESVAGATDTPWRKPEPEYSQWILDQLRVDSGQAILVGDSPFDVEAAKVVGMPVIGVATGSHSRAQLVECGADRVSEDFFEVVRDLMDR